ncbi:hypothetical protein GN956_G10340 [Arapaima gigas]
MSLILSPPLLFYSSSKGPPGPKGDKGDQGDQGPRMVFPKINHGFLSADQQLIKRRLIKVVLTLSGVLLASPVHSTALTGSALAKLLELQTDFHGAAPHPLPMEEVPPKHAASFLHSRVRMSSASVLVTKVRLGRQAPLAHRAPLDPAAPQGTPAKTDPGEFRDSQVIQESLESWDRWDLKDPKDPRALWAHLEFRVQTDKRVKQESKEKR